MNFIKFNRNFKSKGFILISLLVIIFNSSLILSLSEFNSPISTHQTGWNTGSGTTHAEINNTVRYPDGDVSSYVSVNSNRVVVSEFGFSTPSTSTIMNTTLWVYTSTATNAQYTFSLTQGGVSRCSLQVTENTAVQWRACTWSNPSGNLTDLRILLDGVSRPTGGGQANPVVVYIAYLDSVLNFPPVVNLTLKDNYFTNETNVNFSFIATDDHDSVISSCALHGNFSGSWIETSVVNDIQNNSENNISFLVSEGVYVWNVFCADSKGAGSFASENHTIIVDTTPPVITLLNPLPDEVIIDSYSVVFEYNVSDKYDVVRCVLIVNDSILDTNNNPVKDTTLSFVQTLINGVYEWKINCVDEAGNNGVSVSRFLTLSVSEPEITNIVVPESIMLNPGVTKNVLCDVEVFDKNGFENIAGVNASLYHINNLGVLNNTDFYVNDSCSLISGAGNTADFECGFDLWFYASNGSWFCEAFAINSQGFSNHSSGQTFVDTLYAVNISESLIDYGDVSAGDVSEEKELNIFNIGNQPLQVFVRGFGGSDPVLGDGLAMICDDGVIDVENHKYAVVSSLFEDKISLSSVFTYSNLLINKQVSETQQNGSLFFQLFVAPIQVTNCTGTLVISATG